MKKIMLWAMAGLCAFAFSACEPKNTPDNNGNEQQEGAIPSSFPKKQLIEEFTGQTCGYCPYGMDCIHEYIGNDTNYVLVLHHYGFQKDHFSVSGCNTITTALGVSGAPSMTINRAKTTYRDENNRSTGSVVFHPGYLNTADPSQLETETYASININNEYDPSTRELTVRLSGIIAKEEHPDLKLTVLVKESGMIDTQSDYYNTFNGWQEFRHCNAVRAYLSTPKGDEMLIVNGRYSDVFSLTLKEQWVAENCMVVAFISEDFKPVIQAGQKPVVAGTQGGADITHGGVTPVPVPDYYPEPNATDGPAAFSGSVSETLTYTQASASTQGGLKLWSIMAYDPDGNVTVQNTRCLPFTYIYLITSADQTTIPAGTYEINSSFTEGTVVAGYRDDEQVVIDGSTFYFTGKSYFDSGYLDPYAQWLISDGTMTVTESGWTLSGHTRNGADIRLTGSTIVYPKSNAPAKLKRR